MEFEGKLFCVRYNGLRIKRLDFIKQESEMPDSEQKEIIRQMRNKLLS